MNCQTRQEYDDRQINITKCLGRETHTGSFCLTDLLFRSFSSLDRRFHNSETSRDNNTDNRMPFLSLNESTKMFKRGRELSSTDSDQKYHPLDLLFLDVTVEGRRCTCTRGLRRHDPSGRETEWNKTREIVDRCLSGGGV